MSRTYKIMYSLGFTPWEHGEPPVPLAGLIAGPQALPAGDMLDIGCGTGLDAIYCARRGWNVTGVDVVDRALQIARRNANQAGVNIRFVHADIADADAAALGAGYTLLLDVGCLHGLPDESLQRAAATITDVAKPGATLLMLAFAPGRRGPAPRGIDPARIPALFPQWELTSTRPASGTTPGGAVRRAMPTWYRLTRH
ncbi:MAG TPA: class I SAM-dependent methyltransferase [Streptosporangiaceae bacterium]|nr:class I SAM-dependent methyltransferase [Streptosporangiaceae bacterium]